MTPAAPRAAWNRIPPRLESVAAKFLPATLIGAAFAFLLAASWGRWGDLYVDVFEQQWMLSQLASGKVLYRDVFCQYGFLPFYLLSGVERLAGVTLYPSIAVGLVVSALLALVTYRLARLYLSRTLSTILVVTVLFLLAFNCVGRLFSFVLPGNVANTFVALFVNAALYAFIRHFRDGDVRHLRIWAALMTLAFLSRIYIALAAWIAFVAVGLYGLAVTRSARTRWPYLFAPLGLALLAYLAFLAGTDAWTPFYRTVVQRFLLFSTGQDPMQTNKLGVFAYGDDGVRSFVLPDNLLLWTRGLVLNGIAVLMFHGIVRAIPRLPGRIRPAGSDGVAVALVAAVAVVAGIVVAFLPFLYHGQYFFLPLVFAVGGIVAFLRRSRSRPADTVELLALFAVSGAMVARSLFHLSLHYDTTSLLPGLPAYFVVFAHLVPRVLHDDAPPGRRRAWHALAAVFLIGVNLPAAAMVLRDLDQKDRAHVTARGTVTTDRSAETTVFWDVVEYLRSATPPDARVVVFPEGAGINFFAERDNPLWTVNYVPTHVDLVGEPEIIDQMERSAVDYVVLTSERTGSYGYPRFGTDYATGIAAWIDRRYEPVREFGQVPFVPDGFGALVLKRRTAERDAGGP